MLLWGVLAGCWIDWHDLDGDTEGLTCAGGASPVTWFRDLDDDGYGGDGDALVACDPPIGFAAAAGDCDEGDPRINPGTAEACNGIDDDCDFQVDEGGAAWCVDFDMDLHGSPDDVIYACDKPTGYVSACDDCDDGVADVHPAADEIAGDGIDNDCDGLTDEP
jgi:hypothetical protein